MPSDRIFTWADMTDTFWIPDPLRAIARRIDGDPPPTCTVRELLRWFNFDRRGTRVVAYVNRALRELDLRTEPDFEDAWIDGEIAFFRATRSIAVRQKARVQSFENTTTDDEPIAPLRPPKSDREPLSPKIPARPAAVANPIAVVPEQPAPTNPRLDPVHCIENFDAANHPPVCVKPDTPLVEVITLMRLRNFSQIPVSISDFSLKGAVTWRSIALRIAEGQTAQFARDCLVHAPECTGKTSVFLVAPIVLEHGFVLVRDAKNRLSGIVTLQDLVEEFGDSLEPFSLIGEIEKHLRRILDENLPIEMIRSGRAPDSSDTIESASDLHFGGYIRLFQKPEVWERCALPVDRGVFVGELEKLRNVRNEVMHFQREAVEVKDMTNLREFAVFLRDVRRNP